MSYSLLPCSSRPVPAFRRAPVVRAAVTSLVAGAAALAAACGGKDPYAPVAYYSTQSTEFAVYPLQRTTPPYFNAVNLYGAAPVQLALTVVSSTLSAGLYPNFDVAFDLDAGGNVLLLPPKLVTAAQIVPRTGFQVVKEAYDSLTFAPGGTYQADSAFRITRGQTVVVQAQGSACSLASPFYAKLVVDSINTGTGAIYVRMRVDPNCGFKSLAAGVPSS